MNKFQEFLNELTQSRGVQITSTQLSKGDTIEILEEPFVGIQGTIVDEVKNMNKFLIKIGDINSLYIDKDKVKLIEKKIEKREFNRLVSIDEIIKVTIRGRRTTVKLESGIQASVYCHENDEYNENLAIKLAYNKAKRKELDKKYNELLDKVKSIDIDKKEDKEIKEKEDSIVGKQAEVYIGKKLIAKGIIKEVNDRYGKYSVEYTKKFENSKTLRCGFDELNESKMGLKVKLAE